MSKQCLSMESVQYQMDQNQKMYLCMHARCMYMCGGDDHGRIARIVFSYLRGGLVPVSKRVLLEEAGVLRKALHRSIEQTTSLRKYICMNMCILLISFLCLTSFRRFSFDNCIFFYCWTLLFIQMLSKQNKKMKNENIQRSS